MSSYMIFLCVLGVVIFYVFLKNDHNDNNDNQPTTNDIIEYNLIEKDLFK
jgi:hypothetical protein